MQKLAFLFLIIKGINHSELWMNFFEHHESHYSIYIHSKYKMSPSFFKQFEISKKEHTSWYNTMHAQMALIKEALKDPDNQKFIFLSESTIPIQSFEYVYKTLCSHPHSQFDYYPNPHHDRDFRPIPFSKQFKNSQWIVLNRAHAELMATDQKIFPAIAGRPFDNEHYPSTFLLNRGKAQEIVKQDVTMVIWAGAGAHPHAFTDIERDQFKNNLIDSIKKKRHLFARKFSPTCNLAPLKTYLEIPL